MKAYEKMPTVSIVVPVYNSENTVEATIESLLRLKYSEAIELILVDNRSTDRTSRILRSYLPRIRVLQEPRPGQSAARNKGIREARHSIVAFTDADCVVDPDWITELVPPLDDPGIGISGGNIRAVEPCNQIQRFGELLHDHERPINTFRPPYAITMNWASRRSVLLDVGGFDEAMRRGEDCDLSYRIIQAGYRIVYRHGAVVAHRNRFNLKGLFREGFADGFHSVKVLKKHRTFFQQFGHRPINFKGYAALTKSWIRCASKNGDPHSLYDATFNSGKKAGKVLGSLRFGCIEL